MEVDILDIMEIIKKDISKKQGRYVARKYYKYKPTVGETGPINVYNSGKIKTINVNVNCFLYTNYFKLLVKQKKNYLLAKEPEIALNQTNVITVNKVTDTLGKALFNASLDTRTWLHFFVNDNNQLDWIFVHDKEIIPIYDKYNKNISSIIRYYEFEKDTMMVEIWNKSGVKFETYFKNEIKSSEEKFHYEEEKIYNKKSEGIEGKNLPFVPFIPLFNNEDRESDLDGIKDLIDMYNSINSGLVDNINVFQEMLVKLKGFTGNTEQLETIRENMQKYKMVGIPNGGGDNADMEYMAVEIPIEARRVLTDILKENIFKIGQGIDYDRLTGESNITNLVMKIRFSGIDMKANESELQLKIFYEKFIDCINLFYTSNIDKTITFNRSMLFNESDIIDDCLKSMNLLDLETVINNHPWAKGKAKEILLRLKKEKEEAKKEEETILKKQIELENNMKSNDIIKYQPS